MTTYDGAPPARPAPRGRRLRETRASRAALRSWAVVSAVTAGVACVLAIVVAVVTLPPAVLLCLAGASVLGGAGACWLASAGDAAAGRGPDARAVARTGVVAGLLAVALVGAGRAAGAIGVVLLVVLVLAVPDHARLLVRWLRPRASRPTGPARLGLVGPSEVASMSSESLSLAWQVSFEALRGESDARRVSALVLLRRHYLDELERRDPTAFGRWIEEHAHPGADPRLHLRLEPRRP